MTYRVVLLLEVTKLSNQSTSNRIENIRSLGLGRNASDIQASVGHRLVVRVLVLETVLSRHRAVELAAVQSRRRKRIEGLEGCSGHPQSMAEGKSSLLLSELHGSLLSSRNVCTAVLHEEIR